jgi:PAS domain S-box-containing protein
MSDENAPSVRVGLPEAELAEAMAALEAAGLRPLPLGDAAWELEGFFLLDGPSWRRATALAGAPPPGRVAIILGEAGEAPEPPPGAFGAVPGPGAANWAERAASYMEGLVAMSLRCAGGMSVLERRYEDLVHSLPDIVYELDSEGRFTFVNDSIGILGYEPSDLIGRHFSMLLHEEDAEAVDRTAVLETFRGARTGSVLSPKLFNERRSADRKTENLEVRLRRKPGSRQAGDDVIATVLSYGEVTAAGEYDMRSSDKSFIGSVGVIRDITLRRKSEEMLRKLYQAVDQLSSGILIADRSFRIEYVNPGFLKIAGLPPQEVIGAELFSFFEFAGGKSGDMGSLVSEGFDAYGEAKLTREVGDPGSRTWVELHASPVRAPSGMVTHSILICEDISQRKAMEELVSLAKEEAVRANGAKSDFLASMSHELKSPVASVLAAARLIEMGGPEPERRAASIISSAQGLLGMLGDILDFVRFETGSGSFKKFSFPLASFVARSCEAPRKAAEAKGLAFEIGSVPDEILKSDPDRLGRAFAALLDNAVAFTDRGGIRVGAAIEQREGNVPHLVLSVADSGPGIPPEDQARIFAPFVQLSSPYTKRGGAGIGLSLARNIVRALGGEVRLQSEVGRGSVFSLLVPAGEPEGRAPPEIVRTERRAYRLLVVDDNEVNLEYMAAILSNAGHRALTASSGAEALLLLEETPPDAGILDIQMPGMSGIELGRKVRGYAGTRYDPTIPLVALTAFDPEEVERSGVDFDGIFDKPVDVPKLLAFLDKAVDRREAPALEALAALWAGKSPEGGRVLSQALEELPDLDARMRASLESGDVDGFREAARAVAALRSRLGDARGATATRRLALAFPDEDGSVLACRLERLATGRDAILERLKLALGPTAP